MEFFSLFGRHRVGVYAHTLNFSLNALAALVDWLKLVEKRAFCNIAKNKGLATTHWLLFRFVRRFQFRVDLGDDSRTPPTKFPMLKKRARY